jgi:serine/threonine protein kinase
MWQPVALPFKNDSLPLPALPTPDEIRACPNVLWDFVDKVVAINDEIVVKFGKSVNAWEGQAMLYLEQHVQNVPAPRLYAMYRDAGELFLVMQRVPGERLSSIWPSLTESDKDDIVAKIRAAVDTLRQAKSPWPDDFYGSLDGGGVHHYLFWCRKGSRKYLGPFHGEAAFVAGLTGNYRAATESDGRPDFKTRFYELSLPRVLQGHRPTLTHGDLQPKNIMVAERGRNSRGERSFDITLVDWEAAGWYPDFWEYTSAFCTPPFLDWTDDWCWRLHEFLQIWPAEMGIMRMLDKDWI